MTSIALYNSIIFNLLANKYIIVFKHACVRCIKFDIFFLHLFYHLACNFLILTILVTCRIV